MRLALGDILAGARAPSPKARVERLAQAAIGRGTPVRASRRRFTQQDAAASALAPGLVGEELHRASAVRAWHERAIEVPRSHLTGAFVHHAVPRFLLVSRGLQERIAVDHLPEKKLRRDSRVHQLRIQRVHDRRIQPAGDGHGQVRAVDQAAVAAPLGDI